MRPVRTLALGALLLLLAPARPRAEGDRAQTPAAPVEGRPAAGSVQIPALNFSQAAPPEVPIMPAPEALAAPAAVPSAAPAPAPPVLVKALTENSSVPQGSFGQLRLGVGGLLKPGADSAAVSQSLFYGTVGHDELRDFFGSLSTIRIAVPGAPGNGHQAVGMTIAKRVRQLGFLGTYELVYPKEIKEKLDISFQGFNPKGAPVQELPRLGMRAIEDSYFLARHRETVPLAISAADNVMSGSLSAVVTACFEPFLWGYLEAAASPRLGPKARGVEELAGRLDRIEFLPVYGLDLGYLPERGDILGRLLLGALEAQDRAPERFKSGVVVGLFSQLDELDLGRALTRLPPSYRRRVSIASAEDPAGLAAALDATQRPGGLVLLRVGAVSRDLFDYFYSRQTLPGLLEGANSRNLMHVLGLPYLMSTGDTTSTFLALGRGVSENESSLIGRANQELSGDSPGSEALIQFLLDGKDPNSKLSQTYRARMPRSPGDDKIAVTLARAAEVYARRMFGG